MVKIQELNIYPIKGCRAVPLDTVEVTAMGFSGDREFALLSKGERINQDTHPKLARLSASYVDSNTMKLCFPTMEDYYLDLTVGGSSESFTFRGKETPIKKMNIETSSWLSSALKCEVDLMRMEKAFPWNIPLEEFGLVDQAPQTKFIDAAPLLLTNTTSLEDLNNRMAKAVPMNRFRANIVLSGMEEYKEDEIEEFVFPGLRLKRITVCERCIVTTTDQESGERAKDPLLTLSKYRKRKNGYAGGIMFGIYLTALQAGILSVGDELQL